MSRLVESSVISEVDLVETSKNSYRRGSGKPTVWPLRDVIVYLHFFSKHGVTVSERPVGQNCVLKNIENFLLLY